MAINDRQAHMANMNNMDQQQNDVDPLNETQNLDDDERSRKGNFIVFFHLNMFMNWLSNLHRFDF